MKKINKEIYNLNVDKMTNLLNSYQKRHLFKDGTPMAFSFLVTNRCFLKCKHCFYHKTMGEENMEKSPSELTLYEYEKIAKTLQWFLFGIFCGGEPFVRDDFHEIIKIFRENNEMPWCDAATNGQMTFEIVRQVELICKQDKNKIFSLSFSIDGFEEENDFVRGKGTFKKSLETWWELKKIQKKYDNLELNICTVLNSVNQNNLDKFFEWSIEKMKPNRITLLKIRQSPREGEYLKNIESKNYKKVKETLERAVCLGQLGDLNMPQTHFNIWLNDYVYETLLTGKRSFHCYAGKHGGWIDYNGDVSVCEIFGSDSKFKIGNLREYDLNFEKLWNCEKALDIKKYVGKHLPCLTCTHGTEGIVPSMYFEPNKKRL